MTDVPILFSAPMVRALLDGRKTMTRRMGWIGDFEKYRRPTAWQKVRPGDRLWVRESHYVQSAGYKDGTGRLILYRATDPDAPTTWTSSRHMPRWASRLTLVVTETKLERLQDISEADAKAEGIPTHVAEHTFRKCYREDAERAAQRIKYFALLWDSLHGPDAWASNPEVVAMRFTVHHCNIDAMEKAA